jgi:hypothetical protein
MKKSLNRRTFMRTAAAAGIGIAAAYHQPAWAEAPANGKRIGIIGLDTSHSEVFARMINALGTDGLGYKVTVAYHPESNKDVLNIAPSLSETLSKQGIKIVTSMEALLNECDAVLLETIHGGNHVEQALAVFGAGKKVFIDKPLSVSLEGAKAIMAASEKSGVPFFSSSSLRFDPNVQKVVEGSIGRVNGADVFTPADIEKDHLDMAWYAIHGLEMLYTVMGPGCIQVSRVYTENADVVTGLWEDGRIGTVRGVRKAPVGIAGTAFGEKGTAPLGPFSEAAYNQLVRQIVRFFDTGKPPVTPAETLEIFAFMQAADISRKKKGATIKLKI